VAEVEEEGSEASECENREREEHSAQMAEEEARLGGEEQAVNLFSTVWEEALSYLFSFVWHLKAGSGERPQSVEAVKAHVERASGTRACQVLGRQETKNALVV